MVHIRQPFFSIVTAIIFSIMGLLYGWNAAEGNSAVLGPINLGVPTTWGLAGVMFLMAYFAIVHLKE